LFWLRMRSATKKTRWAIQKRVAIFTWRRIVFPIYDYYQYRIHLWVYAGKVTEWEFMSNKQRKG
jgi:hypothetical protein